MGPAGERDVKEGERRKEKGERRKEKGERRKEKVNSIGILSLACPEFLSKGHSELVSETVPKKRNYNVILNLIQDLLKLTEYQKTILANNSMFNTKVVGRIKNRTL